VSKPKPGISRRDFVGVSIGAVVIAGVGCGSGDNQQTGAGGQPGVGGNSTGGAGSSTGGAGTSSAGSSAGGAGTGGAGSSTGGAGTGGAGSSTGGAGTGGAGSSTGGTTTGAGGAATGGKSAGTGGAATGGKSGGTGGAATGGTTAKGGASATGGGPATGGAVATGGTSSAGTDVTPLVALVRDTDLAQATMDAIAKIGLPDLKDKKVIIRPNQIEAKADGTTNPEVIRGIIRAIKAASSGNPTSIIVAEDAFSGNGAIANMKTNGVEAVCTAEGATTMDLSGTATTNRKPANAAAWTNGIDFYNTVYDADYVINAPRCKTHSIANFSMALKAWFGSLKRPSDLHTTIMNKAPEAHLARKEDLVVLDASRCMITGGPSAGGTMKDSNVIVASKDAIAADVTGIAIIRYNGGTLAAPWTQAQIKRALAIAVPGWLTAQADFSYWSSGVPEIADIMAKRA
jgi:uncharacterized protein (DUF362 family)